MSIVVVSPAGKEIGPFQNHEEARQFGMATWPGALCDDREDNPSAWEIRISVRDQTDT